MSTSPDSLVAVDLGGTNVRFAIARIDGGRVTHLGDPVKLQTADYASLATAWAAFAKQSGEPLPRAAAIAIAGPVDGAVIKLTNNPWVIRRDDLPRLLGLDQLIIVNDFGAVAHAVAQLPRNDFKMICGPDEALPDDAVISIVGPGTGLGVAQVIRRAKDYEVIETEGGHVDFAPLDGVEDALLKRLRGAHRRVSAERVVSGSGLVAIYETLAAIERRTIAPVSDDKALWKMALEGEDPLAVAALDRFCQSLGSVAGDVALTQGAHTVVIGGGLGLRLADRLPRSGFAQRFAAKGRFAQRMSAMPVRLITHPEPGLYGAAAAGASGLARGASTG